MAVSGALETSPGAPMNSIEVEARPEDRKGEKEEGIDESSVLQEK